MIPFWPVCGRRATPAVRGEQLGDDRWRVRRSRHHNLLPELHPVQGGAIRVSRATPTGRQALTQHNLVPAPLYIPAKHDMRGSYPLVATFPTEWNLCLPLASSCMKPPLGTSLFSNDHMARCALCRHACHARWRGDNPAPESCSAPRARHRNDPVPIGPGPGAERRGRRAVTAPPLGAGLAPP